MKRILIASILFFSFIVSYGQQQHLNVGANANDHSGDKLRDAFLKVEHNFNEIYLNNNYGTTPSSAIGSVTLRKPQGVFVSGDRVYVVKDSLPSVLTIVDVSVKTAPVILSSYVIPTANNGIPQNMFVQGGLLYLPDRDGERLTIIDVTNPTSPYVVGNSVIKNVVTEGCNPLPIYVQGKYAYTADFCGNYAGYFNSWDISDKYLPVLKGSVQISASPNSFGLAIKVQDNYAYLVGTGTEGGGVDNQLRIIDVRDPGNPIVVSSTEIGDAAVDEVFDIVVQDGLAYMAIRSLGGGGLHGGLQIWNVSNPAAPTLIGGHYGQTGTSLAVSGRRAYMANGNDKIYIYDVSVKTAPELIDSINGGGWKIDMYGSCLYSADYNNHRLAIYNFSGGYAEAATIGRADVGTLDVRDNVSVRHDANIDGGLNVGRGALIEGETTIAPGDSGKTTKIVKCGDVLTNGNIGVNTENPISHIEIVNNRTQGNNPINVVNSDYNKNRTTFQQATDTSSVYVSFTPLGKPQIFIKSATGTTILEIDSTGKIKIVGPLSFPTVANIMNETGGLNIGSNDATANGAIYFRAGNDWRWYMAASGSLLPYVNGANDIGSSSAKAKNGYFSSNVMAASVTNTSVDTASTNGAYVYPVGSQFMRITATDTAMWVKIRLTGSLKARWKQLPFTP